MKKPSEQDLKTRMLQIFNECGVNGYQLRARLGNPQLTLLTKALGELVSANCVSITSSDFYGENGLRCYIEMLPAQRENYRRSLGRRNP